MNRNKNNRLGIDFKILKYGLFGELDRKLMDYLYFSSTDFLQLQENNRCFNLILTFFSSPQQYNYHHLLIQSMREKYYYFEMILAMLTIAKFFLLDKNSSYLQFSYYLIFLSIIVIGYAIEGGRPYTGLVVLIAASGLLGFDWVELIFAFFLGACVFKYRYYHIDILKKGPYRAGFRLQKYGNQELGIYYPTVELKQPAKWILTKKYTKILYDLTFINPLKTKVPYNLFDFSTSFMNRITMPVQNNAKIIDSTSEFPIILFSHGLASNINSYSSLCSWWASNGYIVVSAQHNHDNIRVQYSEDYLQQSILLEKIMYVVRNNDLTIRVKQFEALFHKIVDDKMLNGIFTEIEDFKIKNIRLAGHSFGGATSMETLAHLIDANADLSLFQGIIALDPWLYPLSEQTYLSLRSQNMLFINTETFMNRMPPEFMIEQKMSRIQANNKDTLKAFVIMGSDHIAPTDFIFVVGNGVKAITRCDQYDLSEKILQLHLQLIDSELSGLSFSEMMKRGKSYVETERMEKRVDVIEEWRYFKEHEK